ncbi:hypothetical protein EV175_000144 [Coemansia sp. RSA 1933]|nr:hypothetical protein EV175_000144 [Coemansia sp. RSA 1933]
MVVVASITSFHSVRTALVLVQSDAFIRELSRTLTAWGILFGVGIWMVICQQWSDMRWLRQMQQVGAAAAAPWPSYALLEDVVLDHLPVLERAWISDKLVGSSVFVCILGCCAMSAGWRERLMMVRRIGWMVAVLYFLRSITISVTTVPPSIGSCTISTPQSAWHVILATPQILAGTIGQCTDKIFSGHTAILTISFLFLRRYATHWAVVAYSAVHMTLGVLSVLLARYHYTVDVVVGLLMTLFVHHLYYAALGVAVRRRTSITEHAFHVMHQKQYHQRIGRRDSGNHQHFDEMQQCPPEGEEDHHMCKMAIFDADMGADHRRPVPPSPLGGHLQRNAAVRKREASSATALSESSSSHGRHGGTASDGSSSPPLSLPLSHGPNDHPVRAGIADSMLTPPHTANTFSDHHFMDSDECTHEDIIEMMPLHRSNQHHQDLSVLCDSAIASGCRCHRQQEHYLSLLGVNRPSGSVLPEIVAWMDGLDLRYKCS